MTIKKIGFLLLDQFSMLSFTSALEPLEVTNQLADKTLYEYFTATADGEVVRSSSGVAVIPDFTVAELVSTRQIDALIVIGGIEVPDVNRLLQSSLQRCSSAGVALGGVASGVLALAKAGFLDGHSCSVQRDFMALLKEERPNVAVSLKQFTLNPQRFSCTGGSAAIEMMINRISAEQGADIAHAVGEALLYEPGATAQQLLLPEQVRATQPKLVEIITLMEANLEEPLSLTELAGYVGISRRHLERIFKKHLGCSPLKYYIRLRLLAARQLLKQTSRPIIDVAAACGFVSAAHFSKCYKAHMNITPKAERQGARPNAEELNSAIPAALLQPVPPVPVAQPMAAGF